MPGAVSISANLGCVYGMPDSPAATSCCVATISSLVNRSPLRLGPRGSDQPTPEGLALRMDYIPERLQSAPALGPYTDVRPPRCHCLVNTR